MWFEQLTGFKEESPENVRNKLKIVGDTLLSLVNAQSFSFGKLEIPTLAALKKRNENLQKYRARLQVKEIVADVQALHAALENSHALFQVASQFNLLEMANPSITPEQGIDRYAFDYTQGPACAISCGAGTIYRNYFVEVNGQIGQTAHNQIDCLDLIAKALGNEHLHLWKMQNGYALASESGLLTINKKIANFTEAEREKLKEQLKIGIQWNTEVTQSTTKHKVSQIYCSALPVAYSRIAPSYWEPFARIILEAGYEASLYAAVLNLKNHHSNKVFLTLVGGGAFGNETHWILESLQKALRKFRNVPLDVNIVSYGKSNPNLIKCIDEMDWG
jgi:hypothetical protein